MSASKSTKGVPFMCSVLFLNVFPCIAIWKDVAHDPFGGLGFSEDEESSIRSGVVVVGVGVV